MSVSPFPASTPEAGLQRSLPRHGIAVPLDVITIRSGIPDSLPGRCTDISEAGLGAAVAGELSVNQHVALELKLPQMAVPLRARAVVRHHSRLHCGLQFVNLSVDQREMIRFWAYHKVAEAPEKNLPEIAVPKSETPVTRPTDTRKPRRRIHIRRQHIYVLLAITLVLAACAWLYWEWSWRKLETSLSAATKTATEIFSPPPIANVIRTSPLAPTTSRADL
jgi:hypothetical protein